MKKILLKLLAVTMLTMSFNSFGPVYAGNEAYGYEVELYYRENQFVDMALWIKW